MVKGHNVVVKRQKSKKNRRPTGVYAQFRVQLMRNMTRKCQNTRNRQKEAMRKRKFRQFHLEKMGCKTKKEALILVYGGAWRKHIKDPLLSIAMQADINRTLGKMSPEERESFERWERTIKRFKRVS